MDIDYIHIFIHVYEYEDIYEIEAYRCKIDYLRRFDFGLGPADITLYKHPYQLPGLGVLIKARRSPH